MSAGLAELLPPVRGRLLTDTPLAPRTWFRVGGPVDAWFEPADLEDLAAFLKATPSDVPVIPLGVGSNVLIRDGGIEGVIVRLSGPLAAVRVEEGRLVAGAGASDRQVAIRALEAGQGALAFYTGIPGAIGGAVRMNAGAFGGETARVVERIWALDRQGRLHEATADGLGFGYRRSALPPDWIVVEVAFRSEPGDPPAIRARMEAIRAEREATQPLRVATGGSTFENPPGHKAWQLIDAAGCRGLRIGQAMVSEKHCNFLINLGGATAAEIEGLGETVRARVREASGIELAWEIHRLGRGRDQSLETAA